MLETHMEVVCVDLEEKIPQYCIEMSATWLTDVKVFCIFILVLYIMSKAVYTHTLWYELYFLLP